MSAPRFAALRSPTYRTYFVTSLLALTADNIEHVISYWVIFQAFHSPTLGGFAVISHWMPFLLFSVYAGALADRYERLIDRGILREDERLELLGGLLVVKEPQGNPHAVALGRSSRPEPDISVVRGSARDYWNAAPTDPVLVVEISRSSLALDRARKAQIYARAGIADYWIVNLVAMVLEVRRDPGRLDRPRRPWGYRSMQRLDRDAIVSPLAAPSALIRVADLLR